MANVYDLGDLVRLTATFVASGNAISDPQNVWCLIYDGANGAATHKYGLTPSLIVRATSGCYYLDLDVSGAEGRWRYRWVGSGLVQAAAETAFSVRDSFAL